jgi:hypothetical protein
MRKVLLAVVALIVALSCVSVGFAAPKPKQPTPAQAQAILNKFSWLLNSPAYKDLSSSGRAFFQWLQKVASGQMTALDVRASDPTLLPDPAPIFTQNETTIAFGNGILCGAWNDSSEFFAGTFSGFNGYSRSLDNGATWTDAGGIPIPWSDADGDGNIDSNLNVGDPVNAFRKLSSEFLHATLEFDFSTGLSGIGVYHSTTCGPPVDDDGDGSTDEDPVGDAFPFPRPDGNPDDDGDGSVDEDPYEWNTSNNDALIGGAFQTILLGLDPFGFQDKQWMAVDNTGGAFDGNIYVCWTEFTPLVPSGTRILFTRSTDGGVTWATPQQLSPNTDTVTGCNIAVGPDGKVYVAWERYLSTTASEIRLSRSDDGGATFVGVINKLVASFTQLGDANATCGRRVLNGDIRINEFPSLAVNGLTGTVYVAYARRGSASDKGDIYLARSTNFGVTWTSVKVNDGPTNRDQWFPTVEWANPDPALFPKGVVKVAFYDRRLDSSNYKIDVFAAESINDGVSFLPNKRVTDVSFLPYKTNPNIDPIAANCYMGDYIDMTVIDVNGDSLDDFFGILWGDNRTITTLPGGGRSPDPEAFFDVEGTVPICVLAWDPLPAPLPATPLDFGQVKIGGSSKLAIHATNIGGADCKFTSVTSSSKVFKFIGAEKFAALPQTVKPGESIALIIQAKPTAPAGLKTGNITVKWTDTAQNLAQQAVFGAQVQAVTTLSPLAVQMIELRPVGNSWELQVHGEGVAATQLEVFDLSGRKIFDQQASGVTLQFSGLGSSGERLANGVYLYVVTVKGWDGSIIRSEVRKLVILR